MQSTRKIITIYTVTTEEKVVDYLPLYISKSTFLDPDHASTLVEHSQEEGIKAYITTQRAIMKDNEYYLVHDKPQSKTDEPICRDERLFYVGKKIVIDEEECKLVEQMRSTQKELRALKENLLEIKKYKSHLLASGFEVSDSEESDSEVQRKLQSSKIGLFHAKETLAKEQEELQQKKILLLEAQEALRRAREGGNTGTCSMM